MMLLNVCNSYTTTVKYVQYFIILVGLHMCCQGHLLSEYFVLVASLTNCVTSLTNIVVLRAFLC